MSIGGNAWGEVHAGQMKVATLARTTCDANGPGRRGAVLVWKRALVVQGYCGEGGARGDFGLGVPFTGQPASSPPTILRPACLIPQPFQTSTAVVVWVRMFSRESIGARYGLRDSTSVHPCTYVCTRTRGGPKREHMLMIVYLLYDALIPALLPAHVLKSHVCWIRVWPRVNSGRAVSQILCRCCCTTGARGCRFSG